jgi:hypothetical protein
VSSHLTRTQQPANREREARLRGSKSPLRRLGKRPGPRDAARKSCGEKSGHASIGGESPGAVKQSRICTSRSVPRLPDVDSHTRRVRATGSRRSPSPHSTRTTPAGAEADRRFGCGRSAERSPPHPGRRRSHGHAGSLQPENVGELLLRQLHVRGVDAVGGCEQPACEPLPRAVEAVAGGTIRDLPSSSGATAG